MKVALYGGSFNPPGVHHLECAQLLKAVGVFDKTAIIACANRFDKSAVAGVSTIDIKHMLKLTFEMSGFDLDTNDLDANSFTPTYKLQEIYEQAYPGAEIWHVVGGDLIKGGANGQSEIQKSWQHGSAMWEKLNFAVLWRPGHQANEADLPPQHVLMKNKVIDGSSTAIRNRIKNNEPITGLVVPAVEEYIIRHGLYKLA